MRAHLAAMIAIAWLSPAMAEHFSCPFGGRGACLDFGDTVCSSLGKCVENDAVCFDPFTCNYQGFVCKSAYDNLADDYNRLVARSKALVSEFDSLAADYEDLRARYNRAVQAESDVRLCMAYPTTLEEAREC